MRAVSLCAALASSLLVATVAACSPSTSTAYPADGGSGPVSAPDSDAASGGSSGSSSGSSGGSSGSSSGGSSGGGDPYGAARQACVDHINQLRATLGLPAYARWTANETCTDGQAKADGVSGIAHSAFGQCNESGQCECPGWGSVDDIVPGCLDAMWAEGPGGGHYEIMVSTQYTMVSCGFAPASDGSMWGTQDYQ